MSGPRILGSSVPCLLNAFANWKQPVHCRVRGTIAGGSGAVTVDTDATTVGCSVARVGTAQYQITFPSCRDIAGVHINILQVAPETDASSTAATIDADTAQTLASLGTLKFHTYNRDDGLDDTELGNGNIIDADFWLDLGR